MPNDRLVIQRWRRIALRRARRAMKQMLKQTLETRTAGPRRGTGCPYVESHPHLEGGSTRCSD